MAVMDSILHYYLSTHHHVDMQSPSGIPFTSSYSRSCTFPRNPRLESSFHFSIGRTFGRRCMAANCIRASSDVSKTALNIPRRKNLAVFLSGGGSNFKAIHNATLENTINGSVVVVVSDKPGSKGCEYAKVNNIATISFPKGKHAPGGISEAELVTTLRSFGVDYLILAGYLKLLPQQIVKAYPRSILNVHPALLPAFGGKGMYGQKVHEAVIRSGARFSGPTIHYVDEIYDHGRILAQRVVPVLADDTANALATRVLKQEHVVYVEAIAALCDDRVYWREDGVPFIFDPLSGMRY